MANANEVQALYVSLLQKAKKKIDEAGRSLDDAQHRNEMIQKKLKSIEAIDVAQSDSVLQIEATSTVYDEIETSTDEI